MSDEACRNALFCREREAGQYACMTKHSNIESALEEIEWYQCIITPQGRKHNKQRPDMPKAYRTRNYDSSESSESSKQHQERLGAREVRRFYSPRQKERPRPAAPLATNLEKRLSTRTACSNCREQHEVPTRPSRSALGAIGQGAEVTRQEAVYNLATVLSVISQVTSKEIVRNSRNG